MSAAPTPFAASPAAASPQPTTAAAIAVRVLRLHPERDGDLPLPRYASALAAGADLHAAVAEPLTLGPGARAKVPTGLAIALPPGFEAQVRPRSGLAFHHGVTVLNAPGTIDTDYRGEVAILLINHGEAPFVIRRGDRVAQLVIQAVARAELTLCDADAFAAEATERAGAGFGSTGI